MSNYKAFRILGAATVLSVSALAATAQTTQPSTPPSDPPPAVKPMPAPQTAPMPSERPATAPRPTDKSATKPAAHPLVGLAAFSSDGNRLGSVQAVSAESDGKVKSIYLKTGGFLGLGGKLVAIPEAQFTRNGQNIQIKMTADEVSKLPEAKNQS